MCFLKKNWPNLVQENFAARTYKSQYKGYKGFKKLLDLETFLCMYVVFLHLDRWSPCSHLRF